MYDGRWGFPTPPAAPPPAPPPQPRRRSALWSPLLLVAIALAVLAFAGGFAAVSIADRHDGNKATAQPAPTFTPSPVTPSASDPSAHYLPSVGIQQADVDQSIVVQLVPDGATLNDPTLDLCQANFPSESLRTARFQRVAIDVQSTTPVQTEAVLYKDTAAATQAMSELTKAKDTCPSTPRTDVRGDSVTTRFNPAPGAQWAAPPAGIDRLAFDFTETDSTGASSHFVEAFLRRGRALLGVYFALDDPPITVAGQTSTDRIVNVFAQRLAQLPAGAVQ
jgi:hypothetical protein